MDYGLITAHTFYLLIMGETAITLQDVEVLWRLRVDSLPVTLNHIRRSPLQHQQMVYDLLGVWLENMHF